MRCALLVLCVVAWMYVDSSQAQRKNFRIPSRVELEVALNNPDTVDKALACIEGRPCHLPDTYAPLLRNLGPELIRRRECPARLCTPEQAREAKWLIVQIQKRYPRKFYATVNRLAARDPYF
ncbi:hypothetical protein OTU49_016914 [Cherax quadricarinatus]|uniref:Uncharacterized protein n=1 Tax=Cherax quadricarinatus TaxID=27406 RepID=A0AAW0XQU7_CHEQU|nr:uncharacterized protein LOC128688875 [Cherax quadricarinatus]